MNRYSIFRANKFDGWISKSKLAPDVVTSGVFVNMGKNGTMTHNSYVRTFEQAEYRNNNNGTILRFNDAPSLDDLFHIRGDIIWNESGSSLGWKVLSSGTASPERFTAI